MRRGAAISFGFLLGLTGLAGAQAAPRAAPSELVTPIPLTVTSWLVGGLARGKSYRLAVEPWIGLLERFIEPYRNHTPEWRVFSRGPYGPARHAWVPELCWDAGACDPLGALPIAELGGLALEPLHLAAFASFGELATAGETWLRTAPEPELLAVAPVRPCPRWKAPRAVTVLRYAGEREVMALTDCDGAIASDALDRLSVLARPPGVDRPELPLPDDPQGEDGEWLPSVRLLHPRLVWVVAEIARSFPGRSIVIQSGYRRDGHSGFHRKGQALDLYVTGVDNEQLFGVCRRLRDAGCGFYPNNRFVHVDVRPYATGRVAWVDESDPGAPSRYVDGWPGVLAPGIAWLGGS